jgi:hypothetical protein
VKKKSKFFFILFFSLAASFALNAQKTTPSVLKEEILERIADEVSGSICFEHVRYLSTLHRIWGSKDYHQAAEYVADKSREYGLSEGTIEKYSIKTGRENFWMQSTGGYVPWDLKRGHLRLVKPFPMLIVDSENAPSSVAVDSRYTDTTAQVIFVGSGDSEDDYKGKEVKGKIVLAEGGRHERVHELAVHQYGALGTIQFFNLQGNYLESEGIYWGRIFPWNKERTKPSTFGFNLSASKGFFLKDLLEKGEEVVVSAKIEAEVIQDGFFELATAVIPGFIFPEEEFIFYSHLDHPKPGAHDNASGDAVLLEIARTLSSLIQKKIIPPPARTIRFMWIPHMSGLNMYFFNHPEKIGKIKGGCNIDCVGVNQAKFPSKFHVALPPHSLSTFLIDITNNLVDYLNQKITKAINEGSTKDLLFSPEGSRNLFFVTVMPYQGASDEYTANTRSLNIPSIYFYDSPLPPRHNQINFLEYIDPTNLNRISYLGAIISYAFARAGEEMAPHLLNEIEYRSKNRLEQELLKAKNLIEKSNLQNIHQNFTRGRNLLKWGIKREKEIDRSLKEIISKGKPLNFLYSEHEKLQKESFGAFLKQLERYYELKCQILTVQPLKEFPRAQTSSWEDIIPFLNPEIKGSPGYFSNYFEDRLGEDYLKNYKGVRLSFRYGNVGYYETLNYIDGQNSAADIYEAIQAELWSEDYGQLHFLSFEEISNYLRLLKDAQAIDFKKGK